MIKCIKTKRRKVWPGAEVEGTEELVLNGYRVSVWMMGNSRLELGHGDVCTSI